MKINIKTDIWDNPDRFIKIIYFYQVINMIWLLIAGNWTGWWYFCIITLFTFIMWRSYEKWKKERWPLK